MWNPHATCSTFTHTIKETGRLALNKGGSRRRRPYLTPFQELSTQSLISLIITQNFGFHFNKLLFSNKFDIHAFVIRSFILFFNKILQTNIPLSYVLSTKTKVISKFQDHYENKTCNFKCSVISILYLKKKLKSKNLIEDLSF